MADDTTQLSVTINADASAATASQQSVLDMLAKMEAAYQAVSSSGAAGLDKLTAAHTEGAAAATKHAEAETFLGASIGKTTTAVNESARVFEALGLQTAEASERILAFTEGLEAVGRTAGPLLAVGAAFLAVGAAANLAREGIADAAKEADDFASLEVAVKHQGDTWDEAKESIERFATALQASTTFSKGEAISAINQLVTSGLDYAYAEHVISVATDVAAAKHVSLTEVVNRLRSAIAGHNRGLLELDPTLAALVERHASLQDIVEHLASTFDGQAVAATRNLSGATTQLGHDIGQLGTDFGNFVAGPLETLIRGLDDGVRAFDAFMEGAAEANATHLTLSNYGWDSDTSKSKPPAPVANWWDMSPVKPQGDATSPGHPVSMKPDEEAQRQSAEEQNEQVRRRIEMVSELYRTNRMSYDEALRQEDELKSRYKLTTAQLDDLTMATLRLQDERNHMAEEAARRAAGGSRSVGRAGRSDPGAFDFDPGNELLTKGDDQYEASQKKLLAMLDQFTVLEKGKADAVKLATTAQSEETAKMDEASQRSADATAAVNLLVGALTTEERQRAQLEQTEKTQTAAADAAWKVYVQYGEALSKIAGGPSEDQKKALADLKKNFDELHTAADGTAQKITELTGIIKTNTSSLNEWYDKMQAAPEELAARWRTFNDEVAKGLEMLDKASPRLLEAQQQRQADTEAAQEQEATQGMSLQSQLAYYEARFAQEVAADGLYSDEADQTYKKILDLEKQSYEQRQQAHDAFLQDVQSKETSFIDDLISKHESLDNTLKNVFSDIEKNFEQMVEQMIVKGMGGFNNELAGLFGLGGSTAPGGFGTVPGGGNLPLSDASTYGFFGAFAGSQGAQRLLSAIPTGSGYIGALAGSDIANEIANTPYGVSTNAAGLPSVNLTAGGGGSSVLEEALQGAGIGGVLGSLTGSSTYGSLIGGLGGIAGSLLGGPVGGSIGSIIGGLLGGLFGPHDNNPQDEPDVYNSQTGYYGIMANLSGQATYEGASISSQVEAFIQSMGIKNGGMGTVLTQSNGVPIGAGGIDAVEVWLSQQNPNNPPPGYTQSQWASMLASWASIFGTSSSGSGGITFPDKNVGDILVTGAGNTQQTTYSALESALQQILGLDGSSGAAVYSITGSYPNFSGTGNPVGYWQNGKWISGGPPGSGSGGTPVNSSTTTPSGTVINNNFAGANIVGPGGLASIAKEISQILARLDAGQLPGAPTNTGIIPAVVGN